MNSRITMFSDNSSVLNRIIFNTRKHIRRSVHYGPRVGGLYGVRIAANTIGRTTNNEIRECVFFGDSDSCGVRGSINRRVEAGSVGLNYPRNFSHWPLLPMYIEQKK